VKLGLQILVSCEKSVVLKFRSFWKEVPFVGLLVNFNESLLGTNSFASEKTKSFSDKGDGSRDSKKTH